MELRKSILKLGALLALSFFAFTVNAQECTDFKTGSFYGYNVDSTVFHIVRKKNKQVESSDGTDGNLVMKIEWLSDCRYKLTYLKSTGECNEKFHEFYSALDYIICDITNLTLNTYDVSMRSKGSPEKVEITLYKY